MDFCSIFTIARVIMGSVKRGEKYEGYYYLKYFLFAQVDLFDFGADLIIFVIQFNEIPSSMSLTYLLRVKL